MEPTDELQKFSDQLRDERVAIAQAWIETIQACGMPAGAAWVTVTMKLHYDDGHHIEVNARVEPS